MFRDYAARARCAEQARHLSGACRHGDEVVAVLLDHASELAGWLGGWVAGSLGGWVAKSLSR